MPSWLKILHYRKLKRPCDTTAKALEKSKDAVSTQLPVLFDKRYFSMRLELCSWYFFGLCSSVKEPWKGVIFCKIKVKYLLFLQSLLLESWKYFSLPLVCLWILPWAGRTWLQPLAIKSFPFEVQNIVHAIHMHLHTFTNACTVWVTICIWISYFL